MSVRKLEGALHKIGTTPRKVRAWCCVTFAEYLIGKGTKCDAAMSLAGYHNRTNFNKRFRECLGCLPSESRGRRSRLLIAS
jgi:methylphosphotriester-DNA--protein-cysteine methyltransferase